MTHKSRKSLSKSGMISIIKDIAKKLPNQIQGKKAKGIKPITLTDCILSAFAVFSLKYKSLVWFDRESRDTENAIAQNNLRSLYQIDTVPCDTHLRRRLDEVNPKLLRKPFKALFAQLQRGNVLKDFRYLDWLTPRYLLTLDGTGFFNSESVYCDNCCVRNHKSGSQSYYHHMFCAAIVHPVLKTVIPFPPEPIMKQKNGKTKNDCERVAAKRLIDDIAREHPHLKLIVTGDSLHSNGPFIKQLLSHGFSFILNVKPGSHKTLFDFIEGEGVCKKYSTKRNDKKGNRYEYRYLNNVPLNDANKDLLVNFFECIETGPKGKKVFTYVTNITITEKNILELMRGGRARWRIEDETFNTLKNRGYEFEHNFGHGYKYLSTVFATIMMLAFAVDQIEQHCDPLFQAALKKVGRKAYLWAQMRHYFFSFFIDTWEELLQALIYGIKGTKIAHNTS